MNQLLAWQNFLFYIPLVCGLLLGAGALIGLGFGHGDGHAGADSAGAHATTEHIGHGHGPGHGHEVHPTLMSQLFALLGLGRVPLSISLMMMLLIFGGTGTVLNILLAELRASGGTYAWVSIIGALLAVFLLSGPISTLLARIVPSIETYTVSRRDLIGCTAVLINDTDEQGGYAQARDREGNIHNISCRTYAATPSPDASRGPSRSPLMKGTQVLIVDFDPASNRYTVELGPQDPPDLAALAQKRPRRIATRS